MPRSGRNSAIVQHCPVKCYVVELHEDDTFGRQHSKLGRLGVSIGGRVAENVYQRIAPKTPLSVPGKFEFTCRDAPPPARTDRQWHQEGRSADRTHGDLFGMRLGRRAERTRLTVGEVAQ